MEKLSAAVGSRELLHSNTLKHLRTARAARSFNCCGRLCCRRQLVHSIVAESFAANGSKALCNKKHLRTAAGSEDSIRETSRVALYIQAIVRPTTLLSKQP
jgi:hypothetical protein